MTPNVSSPRRRGATLALSGIFVAGSLLAGAPVAFAAPSADAVSAIDEKGTSFSADYPWFGAPAGEAMDVKDGAMREYEGGTVYYSKDTGAHVMYGEILKRYKALGGPESGLGFPKNDESGTGDGVGRFNEFSAPEGAAIYWNPEVGATVLKGKVLEAWNQSGGIKGPFGYPTADMTDMNGVLTGKFAGPEGTEIQWSKAAGLVTIPAALAAKIPGFGTGASTSVSKAVTAAKDAVEKKGGWFKWWYLLPLLLLLALPLLFRKKTVVAEPVKVAPKVVTPPPAPAPVKKVVAPPPPPRPAPVPPKPVTPPPAPKPVVKTPPPPPAPKPVVTPPPPPRPVQHIREEVAEVKEHIRHEVAEVKEHIAETKAHIREVHEEHEVTPVIRYETHTPTETSIRVTYENNALGDHMESRADKSDLTPDHLQE